MSRTIEVEKCFPLCQLRRVQASLAPCHGLTFGLRTRVHSRAPLRTQLSCRNVGYGVDPAKIPRFPPPTISQWISARTAPTSRAAAGRSAALMPCPALKTTIRGLDRWPQLCPCFSSARCCDADWLITSGKCPSPSCFTPAGKYIGTGTPQGIVDCLKLQSTVREGEPTFPQAGSATKTSGKQINKCVFQGKTFKCQWGHIKLTYYLY